MDLPKRKKYGISCPVCSLTKWFEKQVEAELMCLKSFPDSGLEMVDSPMGLVIGFGKFKHICRIIK